MTLQPNGLIPKLLAEQRWEALTAALMTIPKRKRSSDMRRLHAVSLYKQAKYSEAKKIYHPLAKEYPQDSALLVNIGLCEFNLKDYRSASCHFKAALEIQPDCFPALINQGLALEKSLSSDQVIDYYKRCSEVFPDCVDVKKNFAKFLIAKDSDNDAIRILEELLLQNSSDPEIYYMAGNCFARLHKVQSAIQCLQDAIRLNPFLFQALTSLGAIYLRIGQYKNAVETLKSAVKRGYSAADVCNNLGLGYQMLKNFGAAKKWLSKAIDIDPSHRLAWSQLQNLRVITCDPSVYSDPDVVESQIYGGVSPFTFLALEDDPMRQLIRSQDFAKVHLESNFTGRYQRELTKNENHKVVLGLFSADFKAHATTFLLKGVLANLDKSKFRVLLFSFSKSRDYLTQELIERCDDFIDVSQMSDSAVAELARRESVDIALDLKGFTEHSRPKIFAHCAAPIQINYLGYPGSTGAPWIDYIIADRFIIPPSDHRFYGEKVVYMPHCYQPTDNTRIIDTTKQSKADHGLPESGTVFCSFNQNYKITPVEIDAWSRILREVPNSVLWLFESNRWSKTNLTRAFVAKGVNRDRLIFCSQVEQSLHLARYQFADIFLDCFKVNAHTTASDALWMGVPLITLSGKQFASRVAGSLLRSLGVEELIQTSVDSYVKTAVRLAIHDNELQQLKRKIVNRTKTAPLFDTKLYTRDFEDLLMKIFDQRSNDCASSK